MSNHNYTNYSKLETIETDVNQSAIPESAPESTPAHQTTEVVPEPVYGVVTDCERLNVRVKPGLVGTKVVCVIDTGTKVEIDESASTEEWYKVTLDNGKYGYCMKKYITVQ